MKKVLFGTTALVLSAGTAFADITMSGSAEMGVADLDNGNGAELFQDIDINFSMSGETDNGLSFGASVDLDEQGISGTETDDHGTAVFISGDFGTLTLGDTDGAFDWAMIEVNGAGSIADDETAHPGFYANTGLDGSWAAISPVNDGQVLRYDNTVGDFGFAVSYAQDVNCTTGTAGCAGAGDAIGVGVKGSFGDIDVGFGYTENDWVDIVGVSAKASFGDLSAAINYSQHNVATAGLNAASAALAGASVDHIGIGVTYSMGATTMHANWGEFSGDATADGIGLAIAHDLGGGASAHFGYGDGTGFGGSSSTTWSAGLALSF